MTKIGVGVGEEFPVEDRPTGGPGTGQGPEHGPEQPFCYGPGDWYAWRAARAEWRAARAAWRAQRRAAKAEYWAGQARAGYAYRGNGYPYRGHYSPLPFIFIAVVLVLLLAGFVTVITSAPFFVLGAIVLAVLWMAHRRQRPDDYDVPPPPARR